MVTNTITLPASYYRQFDADPARDVPGEGYGGWQTAEIRIAPEHTAVAVMHAWETGTPEQYPGWHRAVEYFSRASEIVRNVFPPLLRAVRDSELTLYHVASGDRYCKDYPGYQRAARLAGPPPPVPDKAAADPVLDELRALKQNHAFVGAHNQADIGRGFANLTFPPEAEPRGDEGIAMNAHQLAALCKADGINHLIYMGFAINWCLLMSDGGMVDMARRGLMCSAIRQAVTAVENKETARHETCKEIALWRIGVTFGFIFEADDILRALRSPYCA